MIQPPPLEPPEVETYLARIGLPGADPGPTVDWLRRMHLAHLETVPFENLELHAARPLSLDVAHLFDKIVTRRRGGFCYELNGSFASLLRAVGFEVDLVSCRVHMPDGSLSPPFDHLALLADVEGSTFLADVGFGDSFRVPHALGTEWTEHGRTYRTVENGDGTWELEGGRSWDGKFSLDPTPRTMEEFTPRCRWHETSPESNFQRSLVVTRALPGGGRVSTTGRKLILTVDGERRERDLTDEELEASLLEHFDHEMVRAIREVLDR